jgi:hypothetical protein
MAVQLNPSLAPAHAEFGFAKQVLAGNEGGLTHSLDGIALARRISPGDPVLANWLYGIGIGFLKIGENAQAIRWMMNRSASIRCRRRWPIWPLPTP